MSILAVLAVLAVAWWLSLRALDWATGARPRGRAVGDVAALMAQWQGADIPANAKHALRTCDLAELDMCYQRLRADSWRPDPGLESRDFEEALVSLALAEASSDIAKAHRGLEALRHLRCELLQDRSGRNRVVLGLIEARLRLVLADAGRDPHQRALALLAVERVDAASPR